MTRHDQAPLAIAHRAGNSLAGLHAANRLGVDVIECDVHHHRGRLEVRHLKTAGPLPFLWDRWELASASAPRLGLHELLAADEHGTTFMLDLKGRSGATAGAVARLLHDGGHHREVLVCGRHWPSVEHVARLPYVRAVLSARNRVELARLRQRVAAAPAVHGVSVHASLLEPATVEGLLRHVDVVMTWPVNDVTTLQAVLALGANGVISDEPEVLAALLARRRRLDPPG
jgi:glycerophosphoryl diester phosphodiesterase